MNTKILCGLTALGASLATMTTLPSWADQAAPAAKPDETYTGTVTAVDPIGRTLEVKEFLFSKKFSLGDHCAYNLWNKPAGAINDLRAGEKVTVSFQDANGVLAADRIQQDPMTESGKLEAIDPAAHTLTLHSGWTDKTFQIPESCQVQLFGNRSGTPANLEPGYYVRVTYELPQDKAMAREIVQTGATFTGKLTAVDTANRIVKAKAVFETMQFKVADNCAIMINGKPDRNLGDLKPGEELTFSYHDENGSLIVSHIANESASHRTETTSAQPMSSYPYP